MNLPWVSAWKPSGNTVLSLTAFLVVCACAHAAPIGNGDFEQPSIYPAASQVLLAGGAALTDWTVGGPAGSVVLEDGLESGVIPFSGSQWIGFHVGNTPSGGTLSQTFTTVPGESNVLSLALSKDANGVGFNPVSLTVTVWDGSGNLLANDWFAPQEKGVWTFFQLPFLADSTSARIELEDSSAETSGIDLCLDEVVVGEGRIIAPPPPPPAIGPFTNGSFEFGTIPSGTFIGLPLGATNLVGWTIGGPGGDIFLADGAVGGITPYNSTQFLNFNGGESPPGGTISQTFTTAVGETNLVSLALTKAGTGGSGPSPVSMTVTVFDSNGTLLASNWFSPPVTDNVWTVFQTSFVPTTSTSTIVFTDSSTQNDQVSVNLDDVVVAPASSFTNRPPPPPPVVNLLTNGDFEFDVIPAGTYVLLTDGTSNLPGWTISGPGNDVFLNNGALGGAAPYSGAQWINFDGGNTPNGGTLSQTFATTVGESNLVSLALTQVGSGSGPNPVSVTITLLSGDGSLLASNRFSPTPDDGVWTVFHTSFVSTTPLSTIVLKDTSDQVVDVSPNLDDVVVTPERLITNLPPPPPPPPPTIGPFTNGDFAFGAIPSGTFIELPLGATNLVGWTIGGPSGDVFLADGSVGGISPYVGSQWLNFDGNDTGPGGMISQTFATTVGETSLVGLALTRVGNGGIGPDPVSITLTILDSHGTLLASNWFSPQTNGVWTVFQTSFVATTSASTIVLTDSSTEFKGVSPNLADVVITPQNLVTNPPPPPVVNLLTNGDFEFDAIPSGTFIELPLGATNLPGWTIGGPGPDIFLADGSVGGISPYSGSQWLNFHGGSTPAGGTLTQAFVTTVGESNLVSLALTKVGNGGTGPNPVSVTVTIFDSAGTLLASNLFAPQTNAVWTVFQTSFVATTSTSTIVLTDSSSETYGVAPNLDDVIVTPVPIITNAPPPPVTNLLANGNFEFDAIPSGTFIGLPVGASNLPGWTVGGPGGDIFLADGAVGGITPYSGSQWLDFHGGNTPAGGTLSQTFATTVGESDLVSLALTKVGNGGIGPSPVSMTVTILANNGMLLASNVFAPQTNGVWTVFQTSFVATTPSSTIVITDSSAQVDGVAPNLDDVVVAPVDPPKAHVNLVLSPNSHMMYISAGAIGGKYLISSTTNLANPASWNPVKSVTVTNASQPIDLGVPKQPSEFFRAVQQ